MSTKGNVPGVLGKQVYYRHSAGLIGRGVAKHEQVTRKFQEDGSISVEVKYYINSDWRYKVYATADEAFDA